MRRHIRPLVLALFCAALVLSLSGTSASASTAPPQKQVFDYIFVVDVTGSMMGQGSGNPAVIMPQVKTAIAEQIMSFDDGATVVIVSFSKGIKASKTFVLTDANARKEAVDYVSGLKANSTGTWIYSSMLEALKESKRIAADSPGNHMQTLLLFTDGQDNEPGKKHAFADVARAFSLQRGDTENLWFKYQTLGVDAPKADKEIIEDTDGMELIVNPKGKVLPFYNVEVRPYLLDFGNLRRVQESSATVRFGFAKQAAGLPFTVVVDDDELLALGVTPVIEPGSAELSEKLVLKLQLENAAAISEMDDRTFNGMIVFKSTEGLQFAPPQIPFTFRIRNEPVVSFAPEDQGSAKSDLGTLKRSRNDIAAESRRWLVRWSSPDTKSSVTMRVWPSDKNPSALGGDAVLLKTSSGQSGDSVAVTPEDKWVELVVKPGADAAEGTYEIPVYVSGEGVELEVTGGEMSAESPGQFEIATGFKLPKRPMALLTMLLIVLTVIAILLLIVFALFCAITGQWPARAWRDLLFMAGIKKPTFGYEDQLVVKEPAQDTGRCFSLDGRTQVLIGAQGEFLGESSVSFRVEAFWKQHHVRARAVSVEGEARYKQAGEGFDLPFAEQDLVGGDLIRIGNHLVQFESGIS